MCFFFPEEKGFCSFCSFSGRKFPKEQSLRINVSPSEAGPVPCGDALPFPPELPQDVIWVKRGEMAKSLVLGPFLTTLIQAWDVPVQGESGPGALGPPR